MGLSERFFAVCSVAVESSGTARVRASILLSSFCVSCAFARLNLLRAIRDYSRLEFFAAAHDSSEEPMEVESADHKKYKRRAPAGPRLARGPVFRVELGFHVRIFGFDLLQMTARCRRLKPREMKPEILLRFREGVFL